MITKLKKEGQGYGSVEECLCSMLKALGSIPSTKKRKKKWQKM
jgi:hypothetical protein